MTTIDEKLKRMPRTVRVGIVAGGLSEFITIQAAINWANTQAVPAPSAATPYTVEIWPGVYDEVVVMADHVNLRGIDKETCIIDVAHDTLVTMAEGSQLSNLTLNVTSDATASGFGVELNDAACTIENVKIILNRSAGAFAYGILESTGATARVIYIRNVRIQMTDNSNERGIGIDQAGKTVYIENSWIQGSDYGLAIGVSGGGAVASTIYSSHNHYEATAAPARSVFNNGGTIMMNGDTIGKVDHTGAGIIRENNGVITYKDIPLEYEVFAGMSIQDAITAAAADAPAPAATAPYTVLIHPGIYNEEISMETWVNVTGVGPKGSVVIFQADSIGIVTLATQVQISNLTLRMGAPGGTRNMIIDNGVACICRISDIVFELVTPQNACLCITLTGASTAIIERGYANFGVGGTTNRFCTNATAAGTITLIDNDVTMPANSSLLRCDIAGSVWTGGGNRWAGNASWISWNAAGTLLLNGDTVTCTNPSAILAGSSVCLKNGKQQYEVHAGMHIQHAIAAAAADTPAPAASAPYTVLIHPGIYDEAITCSVWVNLKGVGPRGSVVINQDDAGGIITYAINTQLENFTVRLTGPSGGLVMSSLNAVGTAILRGIDFEVDTPGAHAIVLVQLLAAAAVLRLERCFYNIGGTGACVGLWNGNNAANFELFDNDFEFTNVNAFHIASFVAGAWTGRGNRWAGTCGMFNVSAGTITLDNDSLICTAAWTNTASIIILRNCAIEAPVVAGNAGQVRMKNCSYRAISRTGTGNIVDESPGLQNAPWHIERWNWEAVLASAQVGTRGTPVDGGSGQVMLEVTDNGAGQEAVESSLEVAGSLGTEFTPARTPRWLGQIAVDAFDAHVTMFFGLRETLGNAAPNLAAEECAGFDWDGTNFRAVSSDGITGETTNLTTPTVNVHVQLEVIIIGGVQVEFYVDGVLVATHSTAAGLPAAVHDWQHLLATAGAGGGDVIQVTVRQGGCQECPV